MSDKCKEHGNINCLACFKMPSQNGSKSALSAGLAELTKEAAMLLEAYRESQRRKEWEVAERYLAKRTGILMGIDVINEIKES